LIYSHEIEERRARATYDPGDRVMPEFAGPEYYEEQDEYLVSRGLNPTLARHNGWYPSLRAGDSALRIVMPASPAALNFWQARMIEAPSKGLMQKRYQSPHGARGPAVIVVYPPIIETLDIAIVEGPMDALAAADAGIVGISLMGNSPPNVAIEYILDAFQGYEFIVVPDRDSYSEAAKTTTKLAARGRATRLQTILPWKDLAEVPREKRAGALGL